MLDSAPSWADSQWGHGQEATRMWSHPHHLAPMYMNVQATADCWKMAGVRVTTGCTSSGTYDAMVESRIPKLGNAWLCQA